MATAAAVGDDGQGMETVVVTRRPSFRRTMRDNETLLPKEFLEQLEQKRKQLDESIHKYIAAKEREYKAFEKEIKAQARGQTVADGAGGAPVLAEEQQPQQPKQHQHQHQHQQQHVDTASGSASKRRTSSESTVDSYVTGSGLLSGSARSSAIDALIATGVRPQLIAEAVEEVDEQKLAMTGLKEPRASQQRDKEFVGVFTPSYLPAINSDGDHAPQRLERTESAPPVIECSLVPGKESTATCARLAPSLPRAESDTAVQVIMKRPAHLQLAQRTSSSGSSADGKLASALKSPTHHAQQRPKRKRVSLAVGDSIVAPSDNVPTALAAPTSAPSHSRTRSAEDAREAQQEDMVVAETLPAASLTSIELTKLSATAAVVAHEDAVRLTNGLRGMNEDGSAGSDDSVASPVTAAVETQTIHAQPSPGTASRTSARPRPASIDPDGDLFDIEDDDDDANVPPHGQDIDLETAIESEDDVPDSVQGQISSAADLEAPSDPPGLPMPSPSFHAKPQYHYDPEAGLIPDPPTAASHPTGAYFDEATQAVKNLTFSTPNAHAPPLAPVPAPPAALPPHKPTTGNVRTSSYSPALAQQSTSPGFRIPSVSHDPVFCGPEKDYKLEEARAAEEEIYGSSYVRTGGSVAILAAAGAGSGGGAQVRSSFGSLGESYMAKHAEEMMRARVLAAQGHQQQRRREEETVR